VDEKYEEIVAKLGEERKEKEKLEQECKKMRETIREQNDKLDKFKRQVLEKFCVTTPASVNTSINK